LHRQVWDWGAESGLRWQANHCNMELF